VLRDLSERRRVEAALDQTSDQLRQSHRELKEAQMHLIQAAKLESVGRLAAGVAHEVKNPLAIVQLGMDYLQQVLDLQETTAQVFNDMQEAVSRADTVVRGLLDFSRERQLELRPASINTIIATSLQLVRHELTQRNIEVVTDLAEDIPARAFDSDKLQQVFLNLFMNAMHAMEHDGRLRIVSRLQAVSQSELGSQATEAGFLGGDRAILVIIEDSGPGIHPDHLTRLFDPYFTTKPMGEGTGLGLSVSRNIVTLHSGSIDIGNSPGGGARAVLLFRPTEAA
jgi:signal transduction histidine kinase